MACPLNGNTHIEDVFLSKFYKELNISQRYGNTFLHD